MILTALRYKYNPRRGRHEEISVHKPRQRGEPKIIGAQAIVEMFGGIAHQESTLGCNLHRVFAAFIERRNGTYKYTRVVILAQRPGVFEKGIHKNQDQEENLYFPREHRVDMGKRNAADNIGEAFMVAQHRNKAEHDKDRGVGEEGDAALQVANHDGIGGAVVTLDHFHHPLCAIQVGHCQQASGAVCLVVGELGIANPACDEKHQR